MFRCFKLARLNALVSVSFAAAALVTGCSPITKASRSLANALNGNSSGNGDKAFSVAPPEGFGSYANVCSTKANGGNQCWNVYESSDKYTEVQLMKPILHNYRISANVIESAVLEDWDEKFGRAWSKNRGIHYGLGPVSTANMAGAKPVHAAARAFCANIGFMEAVDETVANITGLNSYSEKEMIVYYASSSKTAPLYTVDISSRQKLDMVKCRGKYQHTPPENIKIFGQASAHLTILDRTDWQDWSWVDPWWWDSYVTRDVLAGIQRGNSWTNMIFDLYDPYSWTSNGENTRVRTSANKFCSAFHKDSDGKPAFTTASALGYTVNQYTSKRVCDDTDFDKYGNKKYDCYDDRYDYSFFGSWKGYVGASERNCPVNEDWYSCRSFAFFDSDHGNAKGWRDYKNPGTEYYTTITCYTKVKGADSYVPQLAEGEGVAPVATGTAVVTNSADGALPAAAGSIITIWPASGSGIQLLNGGPLSAAEVRVKQGTKTVSLVKGDTGARIDAGADSQLNVVLPLASEIGAGAARFEIYAGGKLMAIADTVLLTVAPGIYQNGASPFARGFYYQHGDTAGVLINDTDAVDLGAKDDETTIVLYGTGLSAMGESAVSVILSTVEDPGISVTVAPFGARAIQYQGEDQVNFTMPYDHPELKGKTVTMRVSVGGYESNKVNVKIAE